MLRPISRPEDSAPTGPDTAAGLPPAGEAPSWPGGGPSATSSDRSPRMRSRSERLANPVGAAPSARSTPSRTADVSSVKGCSSTSVSSTR
jgi:hypothetical protein